MRVVYSLSLIVFISTVGFAYAKQTKELMPDGELEAFISEDELSRIKVIDDRIKAVRSTLGDLEVVEDARVGDVYIKPSRLGKPAINIFVATEKDHTYKLLLIPQKMPSEQIFIKNKVEPEVGVRNLTMKESVVQLVKDMRLSKESKDFKREEVSEVLEVDGNSYSKTAIYRGNSIVGEVLEFQNNNEEHFVVSPEIFISHKNMQVIALSFDQNELRPGDKTWIYVVKRSLDE